MAQIPTIAELYTQIKDNLETELGMNISTFGRVFLNALAAVQAAKMKLIWLYGGRVKKNIFVDTADPEAIGGTLERFGRVKLGRNPFAATQGLYTVEVSGTVSSVVQLGTIFKANDDSSSPGKLYILDVQKTIGTDPDTMQLRALTAGIDGRLTVGDKLTATSPLLNINDEVEVTVEDEIPLTAEGIEEYRQAVLNAFQLESQGGAATDYRVWSADAQGVRFVYPYATSGECAQIDLYVEANQADSTDGKGTPTAQILSDVEDVVEFDPDTTRPLNERGRRPLGVSQINFLAVTPKDVEITLVNATNIDADKQTSIDASLTQHINDVRPFVDAADIPANQNDTLDKNKLISIIQGLLEPGESFDSLTLVVDSSPVTNSITFDNGDIPFLDSVTYA